MEYVVYLSESKIGMLYDQEFGSAAETETGGELKIGPFTIKRSRKKDNKANRFEKLERVTAALSDRIGSPFDGELPAYVSDTLTMSWRSLRNAEGAIYWLGEDYRNGILAKVLLIGSARNVIGAQPQSSGGAAYSSLSTFLEAYGREFEIAGGRNRSARRAADGGERDEEEKKERIRSNAELYGAASIISRLEDSYLLEPAIPARYRFLAKCLARETRPFLGGEERYIIATPLYVAQAD